MIVQPEKLFFPAALVLLLLLAACSPRELTLEERLAQVDALLAEGEHAAAIERLEALSAEHPNRVDIQETLAFTYIETDQPLLAGFNFSIIADEVEDAPEYRLYAAEAFNEIGDRRAMLEQYRSYLEAVPSDRSIWKLLAEILDEAGNRSEALEAYLRVDRLRAEGSVRVRIGELYLQAGNLSQAQSWFARALDTFPDTEEDALYGLFETAWRSERFADAETLLAELEEINPNRIEDGRLASAKDQLEEWRRRQDEAAEAAAAIAARRQEDRDDSSERDPAEASDEDEREPDPEPGDEVAATAEPEPSDGVTATAEPEPETTAEERPARDPGLRSQARQALNYGNAAEAVALFRQALVDHPDDADLWRELSEAALRSGDTGWAQAAASEALRIDPDNPRTVLQYIRASSDQWTPNRWLQEMEAAYRQFPRTPEIILQLARGYLSLDNNRRSARMLYDEFLRVAPPDHPERPIVETERNRL